MVFLMVPLILFVIFVAPLWIFLHYRNLRQSSRSLSVEDRHSIEEMLATVDRLTERIEVLEALLDSEHPDWRDQNPGEHYAQS